MSDIDDDDDATGERAENRTVAVLMPIKSDSMRRCCLFLASVLARSSSAAVVK